MNTLPSLDAVERVDVPALRSWLEAHTQHLVDDLVALAELETPSDDPELLRRGLKHVDEWVTDRLGAPANLTQHRSDEHGGVLVLDYPGHGPHRLLILGHYDTVFDVGTLHSRPVQVDGDRLSGPGVFDMKGGLVQLVWAMRALSQLATSRPPVRLVFNGDEEIGSPFSRPILEEAGTDAAAVLVFEASADGAVKTARKGVGIFNVAVQGVESHAGLDPLAGASAVGEIARVITTLHEATDLRRGTSINVGTVRGGTRANVVAGSALIGVDVRVATDEERHRVDDLLASLAPLDDRVTIRVTGGWNRPVMARTDQIAHMYQLARATGRRVGIDLRETSVGGASDGNFLAAHGLPVLDGLGAVGGGAHARHEHVSISGMVERSALAAGLIAAFSTGS